MHGIGTLVNCGAVILGSVFGLLAKGGLPKRFEKTIFSAVGLAVIFIGLGGALSQLLVIDGTSISTRYTMMIVLALVLGAVFGELLDIEARLDRTGEWVKKKLPQKLTGSTFVDGFVTASMLFCVGAMAIVGSLNDGLTGDCTILFTKSVLDFITAILLSASLGFGVAMSVIPLLLYQGGITLLAQLIRPYMTAELIGQLSCVGSILIVAIGINVVFGKKLKVGNLLPAMLFPILLAVLKAFFPNIPF
ncbi:MAG: DUF554 domain-containing protein [Oscillospiraceae bacterium]